MGRYTQANQPMRVKTALGADVLLLDGFQGVDGVSMPFSFQLELLSEDAAINAKDMLRTAAVLTFKLPGDKEQQTHGLINRFVQLGQRDDLTAYRAQIVPWLWFLSLSSECRIYQNQTALEIIEAVFKKLGYSDFDIRCRPGDYPKREYCVQYRETHLNFVSRLMEEEGIFYFFEHTGDRHVLVLADANSGAKPVAGRTSLRVHNQAIEDEDVVWTFEREHAVHTGKITLRDYDYLQPSLTLENSLNGNGPEEVYDYPGGYCTPDEGDRRARIQLEAEEALHQVVRAESNAPGLRSGGTVKLEKFYRGDANTEYLLLRVQHSMSGGGYRAWSQADHFEYHNTFLAIPNKTPYRPARETRKHLIHGSQTALVVGSAGEEIWVDKYGRVKVQFYWDRDGKKDEKSSCWVRVASVWAGKAWGGIQIPRIGQEVIVEFLEGDPDRPIITGRVYNAEQMPPYELPANATQSGLKSRSSKGAGTDNFNEIRFEDKKGSELFYVHAEKDRQMIVENNNDESIGKDEKIDVGENQTLSVAKNRTKSVGEDETVSVDKNRTESVGKNESISIGESRTVTIDKNESLDVGKDREQNIGGKETVTVKEKRTTTIGKDDELSVGKKLLVTAADEILLKTGSASIELKKDGTIKIKGKDITIEGSGKINLKASSDITMKGSKIKQN